jgi:hypothetical protein
MNGNLYTFGRTIKQGDVSMNSRLFVNGDVSMNSRLFVTNDVSFGARLFVNSDASMNGNLYTFGRTIKQGDVSMNSRLFVNGDVSMTSRLFVTNDVSFGARLFVNGDVSMNSRLFVTNDVSLGARLFVNGDASMNGNLYTFGRTILRGDVSMNSRLFVNGDVSMNSRLFVTSDVSFGARLFANGLNTAVQKVWNTIGLNGSAAVFTATSYILAAKWSTSSGSMNGIVRLFGSMGTVLEPGKASFDFYFTTRSLVRANGNVRSDMTIATFTTNYMDFRLTSDASNYYLYLVLNVNTYLYFDFTISSSMSSLADLMTPTITTVGTTIGTTQISSVLSNLTNSIYQIAGNVGIGTTNPQYTLDVNGNIRCSETIYTPKLNNGGDLSLPTGTGTLATQSYVTSQNYLTTVTGYAALSGATFTNDVRVNTRLYIGINDPGGGGGDSAWLEYVAYEGEKTVLRINTYNDDTDHINLQSSGNVGINKDLPTYKLDVNGSVNATSYNATSDIRIKKNILNINGIFALDVLRKLEPKKYSFIDREKENEYTWGFIGQEIADVFDYATTQTKEYIPNIYDFASVSNNNRIISLQNKTTDCFTIELLHDSSLSIIRLLTINKKREIIRKIDKIIDDKTFSITEPILDSDLSGNSLFVYGQYVHDFYSVNYTSVFTITTAAVKEIDRELQNALLVIEEQDKNIQKLTDEMDELKTIVKSLIKNK